MQHDAGHRFRQAFIVLIRYCARSSVEEGRDFRVLTIVRIIEHTDVSGVSQGKEAERVAVCVDISECGKMTEPLQRAMVPFRCCSCAD